MAHSTQKHKDIPGIFGPYQIESVIGRGGVAIVYSARRSDEPPVALKVLTETAAANEEVRTCFEREYQVASQLTHPNVVRVLDRGEMDGRVYMTMDLVQGETLEQRLSKRKRLDEAMAIDIARQLADALDYIHKQGIVHRDIKPSNVILTDENRAMLFDFGTVLKLDEPESEEIEGRLYGTPRYVAPEQARGSKFVDGRADLYGLGILLYQMTTGRTPFYGGRRELLRSHIYELPPRPSIIARVSSDLEAVILKAIDKNVMQRFQTGAEMIQALDAVKPAPAPEPVLRKVMRWISSPFSQTTEVPVRKFTVPTTSNILN